MEHLERSLAEWGKSLCQEVDIGSLFARNATAHRWKATTRSLVLREAIGWRTHDLLTQALALFKLNHVLGCRILVRSAIESIALLAYLNLQMRQVVSGSLPFLDFSDKTTRLILGSKDKSTEHESINIMTIIGHVEKRFPGIGELYAGLSESAHPNYEGTSHGYGSLNIETYVTKFQNQWATRYLHGLPSHIESCIALFYLEYNEEWIAAFEELERWLEHNHESLQARSNDDA
jgi:hypothetical protein